MQSSIMVQMVAPTLLFFSWFRIIRKLGAGGVAKSNKSLKGKVAIVTGANTGIGRATALELAKKEATVVLACRNLTKGAEAVEYIKSVLSTRNLPIPELIVHHLDLSDLDSVRQSGKELVNQFKNVDFLINNAGVMMCPLSYTKQNYELQFGSNHLGHYLFTKILLPSLRSSKGRVVSVSSTAHEFAANGIPFDKLTALDPKDYSKAGHYGISKLANLLHMKMLQVEEPTLTCNSCHPGVVQTELGRHFPAIFQSVAGVLGKFLLKNPYEGCQTSLTCALEDSVVPGAYYSDCVVAPSSSKFVNDIPMAKKLWDYSEKAVADYCLK